MFGEKFPIRCSLQPEKLKRYPLAMSLPTSQPAAKSDLEKLAARGQNADNDTPMMNMYVGLPRLQGQNCLFVKSFKSDCFV